MPGDKQKCLVVMGLEDSTRGDYRTSLLKVELSSSQPTLSALLRAAIDSGHSIGALLANMDGTRTIVATGLIPVKREQALQDEITSGYMERGYLCHAINPEHDVGLSCVLSAEESQQRVELLSRQGLDSSIKVFVVYALPSMVCKGST